MQAKKLHLMHPWQEVKEMIKEIVPFLTDEDLELEEGKEEELWGRLQNKTGRTREELTKWLKGKDSDRPRI